MTQPDTPRPPLPDAERALLDQAVQALRKADALLVDAEAQRDAALAQVATLRAALDVIARGQGWQRDYALAALADRLTKPLAATADPQRPNPIAAAEARIRADERDRAVKAVLAASFGPPSMWGADRPTGWHMARPPSPEEASHHDNGVIDAFRAIRALAVTPGASGTERADAGGGA